MARIELDHVSLTFRVRSHGRITFKEYAVRQTAHLLFKAAAALPVPVLKNHANGPGLHRPLPPRLKVRALQDVSLQVVEGDRLGIIGGNGAGKSTMLKLMAGVYPPTRGQRRVEGRISSLFDIALGFEGEATGWENINYRGFLQGETPASIRAKTWEIAEFSELGKFLDMPVRFYSAGMMVRLAFAIATAIEPEILLIDEVLSVGDMAFQHKARQRMREMMAKARLMVVVSHDLPSLANLCTRGIWLKDGRLVREGPMNQVIEAYTAHVQGKPLPAAVA